jgi:hypothetical protein
MAEDGNLMAGFCSDYLDKCAGMEVSLSVNYR